MARKDWLTQHGERHTEALESDKALNGDQQHAPRTALLKEGTQIFTGKKTAYLLADSFREDSLLGISREKQADIRMKTKEQLQKQSPTPSMTSEFSIHELNCTIRQLKNKKATGKDGISNEMIRHLGSLAKQKLLDIYSHSWNIGTFPTSWKEAIIIPILKKGEDRHSKTSYRPISLLSCLGKTMERMVNRRFQHHLEKNGLLSPSQSGFRKNRSRGPRDTAHPGYREWLPAEDEDTGCLCRPHQGFRQSYGRRVFSSTPKEESLRQHLIMDPELVVPEINTSQP